jgi:hypothetical protein
VDFAGGDGILHADAYARFNNLYQPDPLTGEAKLVERVSKKGSDPLPW